MNVTYFCTIPRERGQNDCNCLYLTTKDVSENFGEIFRLSPWVPACV